MKRPEGFMPYLKFLVFNSGKGYNHCGTALSNLKLSNLDTYSPVLIFTQKRSVSQHGSNFVYMVYKPNGPSRFNFIQLPIVDKLFQYLMN